MTLFYTFLAALAWQAALIAAYHFGEVDAFWFGLIEIASAAVTDVALFFAWIASLHWGR